MTEQNICDKCLECHWYWQNGEDSGCGGFIAPCPEFVKVESEDGDEQ